MGRRHPMADPGGRGKAYGCAGRAPPPGTERVGCRNAAGRCPVGEQVEGFSGRGPECLCNRLHFIPLQSISNNLTTSRSTCIVGLVRPGLKARPWGSSEDLGSKSAGLQARATLKSKEISGAPVSAGRKEFWKQAEGD